MELIKRIIHVIAKLDINKFYLTECYKTSKYIVLTFMYFINKIQLFLFSQNYTKLYSLLFAKIIQLHFVYYSYNYILKNLVYLLYIILNLKNIIINFT